MKGVLILTEGRSGSTWLGTLANSTGVLGQSAEWLDRLRREPAMRRLDGPAHAAEVIARASGAGADGQCGGEFFSVKLFPRHLFRFHRRYGLDFIRHVAGRHEVLAVRLTRRDRLAQAISYARAMQSRQWTSRKDTPRSEPVYDFERICRSYLLIQRSCTFWESYCTLRGLPAQEFVYEDLLASPQPWLRHLADHAGIAELPDVASDLRIQRSETAEAWRVRFLAEAARASLPDLARDARPRSRTPLNLARFLLGREMKPYAYSY